MKRIEGARKQQVLLICLIIFIIAVNFPMAMSGKALGALLWLGASILGLTLGITRLQVFAKPTVILMVLFAASFLIPVEVAVARGQPFGIRWMRCEVIGMREYIKHPKSSDEQNYIIVQGCLSPVGVEPRRVVKISIPGGK